MINRALEKELSGFGEIFRMLSYQEVGGGHAQPGDGGHLSRQGGDQHAGVDQRVRLAMDKLVLPEIRHLVWELVR